MPQTNVSYNNYGVSKVPITGEEGLQIKVTSS